VTPRLSMTHEDIGDEVIRCMTATTISIQGERDRSLWSEQPLSHVCGTAAVTTLTSLFLIYPGDTASRTEDMRALPFMLSLFIKCPPPSFLRVQPRHCTILRSLPLPLLRSPICDQPHVLHVSHDHSVFGQFILSLHLFLAAFSGSPPAPTAS
jgi:hypothetical protein